LGKDLKERNELLEAKLKELQSSTDTTLRKTYELLVLMIKNAKTDLNSELPSNWEIARILDIEENQISKLKHNINTVFRVPILLKVGRSLNTFNPNYFFDLREAVEKYAVEKLPPITFQQLLSSALELVPENCRTGFSSFCPSSYISGRELIAIQLDKWKDRPPEWNLFEDVAPPNIEVLLYEEKPRGFYVKTIASKSNKCLETILEALERVAKNRVGLEIEKVLVEPIGRTLAEIKEVLEDEENKKKGYVPLIAATLLKCSTSAIQYNEPILKLLKSKGWIREEREGDLWRGEMVHPFVSLAYKEYLTEEEKRKYQTFGLSNDGAIDTYSRWHKDQLYEMSILIPYIISSDPSFPFSLGEKVNVRIKGNAVIIKKKVQRGRKLRQY
jgi:hypothetical protein